MQRPLCQSRGVRDTITSTKFTLLHHQPTGHEPAWDLYEQLFEPSVIYLELRGVHISVIAQHPK
jgi:hypothetical protein